MDPTAVSDALFRVSGANGFAFDYAHWDTAVIAAKFGDAIAKRDDTIVRGAAVDSALDAISSAEGVGIPIHESVSPDAVQNGAKPGNITVAAFSFTSGGSTYSVTPGTNGTLVGTKDGKAWQTWQLIPTGVPGKLPDATEADTDAAAALQAVTLLNARKT